MSNPFLVGDLVECVDGAFTREGEVVSGAFYDITSNIGRDEFVTVSNSTGIWKSDRFRLIKGATPAVAPSVNPAAIRAAAIEECAQWHDARKVWQGNKEANLHQQSARALRALIAAPPPPDANLCQDEGCPQHGTSHVCLSVPPPDARDAEIARLRAALNEIAQWPGVSNRPSVAYTMRNIAGTALAATGPSEP